MSSPGMRSCDKKQQIKASLSPHDTRSLYFVPYIDRCTVVRWGAPKATARHRGYPMLMHWQQALAR